MSTQSHDDNDPHTYLWTNICKLLRKPSDSLSLDRAQELLGAPRSTIQKLRAQGEDGTVQLKSLVTIADSLDVPIWQLLAPGAKLNHGLSDAAYELGRLYDSLPEDAKHLVYVMAHAARTKKLAASAPDLAADAGTPEPAERPKPAPLWRPRA